MTTIFVEGKPVTEGTGQTEARLARVAASEALDDAQKVLAETKLWQSRNPGNPKHDALVKQLEADMPTLEAAKAQAYREWEYQQALSAKDEQSQLRVALPVARLAADEAIAKYDSALLQAMQFASEAQPLIDEYNRIKAAIESYSGLGAVPESERRLRTIDWHQALNSQDPVEIAAVQLGRGKDGAEGYFTGIVQQFQELGANVARFFPSTK